MSTQTETQANHVRNAVHGALGFYTLGHPGPAHESARDAGRHTHEAGFTLEQLAEAYPVFMANAELAEAARGAWLYREAMEATATGKAWADREAWA